MPFPEPDTLKEIVEPAARQRGLDVEDIKTTQAGKKSQVVIRVDGDTHPSSDVLEELSREISGIFDAAEADGKLNFGAGYTLEVSTPGVDLPLTAPRHWRRNRGRLVSIEHGDVPGKSEKWRIGALDDADHPQSVALFRSKKKQLETRIERLENISRAVVEIEFAQTPAAEKEAADLPFAQAEEKAAANRED